MDIRSSWSHNNGTFAMILGFVQGYHLWVVLCLTFLGWCTHCFARGSGQEGAWIVGVGVFSSGIVQGAIQNGLEASMYFGFFGDMETVEPFFNEGKGWQVVIASLGGYLLGIAQSLSDYFSCRLSFVQAQSFHSADCFRCF